MTSIRVNRPVDEWEKVPRRMPDDWRLSLDARLVAVWITTRTDNFKLSVGGIRSCLQIGKDAWRRIRNELCAAGYLQSDVGHGEAGRFESGLIFNIIPAGGFPEKPPVGTREAVKPSETSKKEKKTPAQPAAAEPSSVEPSPAGPASTRDLNKQNLSLSLTASQIKEAEDREFAIRLGRESGLSDAEVDAVLRTCRYASEMPNAMKNATRRTKSRKPPLLVEREALSAAVLRARTLRGRTFAGRGRTVLFKDDGVLVDDDRIVKYDSEKLIAIFRDIDESRLVEQ